ncbi:SHOCT domain-containing protein [Geodermatophilus sabuli]|uniref:Putative membrane protein n=1 Tax=Geodermatophilus sabuli TaxID=1564158 RepID=A0A285EEB0_9ACTN|nr:SHOCT domain-containing protein [Geodermatophilus sabuli]MBB3086302.1 putative membrane protein [Geodermatophilus sabuli]SNX97482.1 putative membrane protein [Geodermatophilus sabuli]
MYWPDHMNGWGWMATTVAMVLFWGLIVAGGVLLVRALNRRTVGPVASPDRPTPQQILAERLARGDIDEEEYRRRLAALSSTEHPTTAP